MTIENLGKAFEAAQQQNDEAREKLPAQLRAMTAAMDMVFNAVTKPKQTSTRQLDIETAILTCPGFDYLLASEIFAALYRRLELRYENNLNTELECRLKKLSEAFDHITGY